MSADIVQGQRYKNYEGPRTKHLDPRQVCDHIFVEGIDIGRCGQIANRILVVFEGLDAWTQKANDLESSLSAKLLNADAKGDEDPEALLAHMGITEQDVDILGEQQMADRLAAEQAALRPVWVPRGLVGRIKELYARSKSAETPPNEKERLAAEIRQMIAASELALFS